MLKDDYDVFGSIGNETNGDAKGVDQSVTTEINCDESTGFENKPFATATNDELGISSSHRHDVNVDMMKLFSCYDENTVVVKCDTVDIICNTKDFGDISYKNIFNHDLTFGEVVREYGGIPVFLDDALFNIPDDVVIDGEPMNVIRETRRLISDPNFRIGVITNIIEDSAVIRLHNIADKYLFNHESILKLRSVTDGFGKIKYAFILSYTDLRIPTYEIPHKSHSYEYANQVLFKFGDFNIRDNNVYTVKRLNSLPDSDANNLYGDKLRNYLIDNIQFVAKMISTFNGYPLFLLTNERNYHNGLYTKEEIEAVMDKYERDESVPNLIGVIKLITTTEFVIELNDNKYKKYITPLSVICISATVKNDDHCHDNLSDVSFNLINGTRNVNYFNALKKSKDNVSTSDTLCD